MGGMGFSLLRCGNSGPHLFSVGGILPPQLAFHRAMGASLNESEVFRGVVRFVTILVMNIHARRDRAISLFPYGSMKIFPVDMALVIASIVPNAVKFNKLTCHIDRLTHTRSLMSFYDQYHQEQTGEEDKVAGPNTPHGDAPHHYEPVQGTVLPAVKNIPEEERIK